VFPPRTGAEPQRAFGPLNQIDIASPNSAPLLSDATISSTNSGRSLMGRPYAARNSSIRSALVGWLRQPRSAQAESYFSGAKLAMKQANSALRSSSPAPSQSMTPEPAQQTPSGTNGCCGPASAQLRVRASICGWHKGLASIRGWLPDTLLAFGARTQKCSCASRDSRVRF
jgi:hypothetical protein